MSLPVNNYTWEIDSNLEDMEFATTYELNNQIWNWKLKDCLCGGGNITTNPWVVVASADATTYNSSGDEWTVSKGTNLDSLSWVLLQRVDGAQMVIQVGTNIVSYGWWYWVVSPGGLFSVAGAGLNTRPTAADEIVMWNNASIVGTTPSIMNVMQSENGLNFRAWMYRDGVASSVLMWETPEDSTGGTWTNPNFLLCNGSTSGSHCLYSDFYSDDQFTNGDVNGTVTEFYMTCEAVNGTPVPNALTRNDVSGEWAFGPIGLYSTTVGVRGRLGQLRDIWWGAAQSSDGTTFTSAGRTYIQVGDLILPWDGSNPLMTQR